MDTALAIQTGLLVGSVLSLMLSLMIIGSVWVNAEIWVND
jgi:hypothetical protein